MGADYTLSAKITADASGFKQGFKQAEEIANGLSGKVKGVSQNIMDFSKKTTMVGAGITAGVTLPFVGAVKTTAEFENAMTKAGVIAGASAGDMKKMTAAALDLGAKTSLSAGEVATAMTEMAAKGFDATQTIAAMPGVISAAEASGEDLALTAEVVTSALNGFGLSADKSTHVADVLAMSANKTAAGVSDLGYSFKYAAPVANDLGISLEELAASTGFMVDAGLAGSQAGTTLRMAMLRLVNPPKSAAEAMAALNFEATDSQGNFKSVAQIVEDLGKSMQGMTDVQKEAALAQIFGTEAASGMAILMREGAGSIREMTKELENSDGASAKAAAAMKDNLTGSIENLTGAIESATISIASRLTPMIQAVAEKVTTLVEKFSNLPDGLQNIIAFGALGAAALGPLITIFGFLGMGVSVLLSTIAFLISPIGLIAVAVVALGSAFGVAYAKSEPFRAVINGIGKAIADTVGKIVTISGALTNMFKGNWAEGASSLQNILPDSTIQKLITGVTAIQEAFSKMGSYLQNVFSTIGPQIGAALSGFLPTVSKVFSTLVSIFSSVVPVIATFVSSFVSGFQSVGGSSGMVVTLGSILLGLNPVIRLVIAAFSQFGPQISSMFKQLASQITPLVGVLGNALGTIASTVLPVLISAFTSFVPVIMQVAGAFLNIVSMVLPVFMSLITQIVPIITQLVVLFAGILAQVMPLVAVLISSLLPVIMQIVQVVMNIVSAAAPALIAIIQAIMAIIQALMPVIMLIVTVVVQVIASVIATISPIVAFIGGIISSIISIIAPIVSFIAGIIASIVSVISPIIATTAGIFSTVFSVVSGVFRNIVTFIGSAIAKVSGIISKISGTVSNVFNTISGIVSSVMSGVSGTITGVFSAIQGAWSGLTGFVGGIFNGISGSVQTLVGQVKGFINGVIGGINAAVGIINKIPGVSIGKIPNLQSGATSFQGGFARMNEGGRGEMVLLPSGTQVIPHDVSMKYAKESARNSGNGVIMGSNGIDTSRMEKWLEVIAKKDTRFDLDGRAIAKNTDNHLGQDSDLKDFQWGV
ncbi:phage tail tape measure protein [Listeria booriae]|uniref:phage tail tape measure protein n=1 Tax=Listeria booriae TaxID=1552123 RepID=UPI0016288AB6|nr:phage tail tape measure protein [Listeria booriae]MBC2174733.1 phage tail tape measure protein [Listeria booriae]